MSLSTIIEQSRSQAVDPAFVSGHYDPSRHYAVSPKLFFRKVRAPGSGFECLDTACDLICSRLAQRLSLPVPYAIPISTSSLGFGLIGALAGARSIVGTSLDAVTNRRDLAPMLVFEQLIANVDDKADHFRLREISPGRFEFMIADHGHTFHCWRPELQDPDMIPTSPALKMPSSNLNVYGIRLYSELEPHIQRIATEVLESIQPVLSEIFRELETLKDVVGLQGFLAERARHETIITKIVQIRAKYLAEIIRQKASLAGIQMDVDDVTTPDSTSIVSR